MTIYIIGFFVLVLLLVPVVVIAVKHFAKRTTVRREGSPDPKNGTPVTLDRSPEMPKMPGATS